MSDEPSIRRLGEGYEPHVDEHDGALAYSFPVDSGFVSASFSFEIQEADLAVMLNDPFRRAALDITTHTVLQRSMQIGSKKVTQSRFTALVAQILHSTQPELDAFLRRFDVKHHMLTQVYIDQVLGRRE